MLQTQQTLRVHRIHVSMALVADVWWRPNTDYSYNRCEYVLSMENVKMCGSKFLFVRQSNIIHSSDVVKEWYMALSMLHRSVIMHINLFESTVLTCSTDCLYTEYVYEYMLYGLKKHRCMCAKSSLSEN